MCTLRNLALPTLALAAVLLSACSEQAPAPSTEPTPTAVSTAPAPEPEPANEIAPSEVVRKFFETLMAEGDADVDAFLTQESLAAMEDGEASFHGERIDNFTLGASTIEGDSARQSIVLDQEGEEHELSMLLRKQNDDWRIHGFAMPFPGGEDWVIDFESESGPLDEMAETLATELGNSLEEAFEGLANEMSQGMENWQADWSAEQAEEQAQRFESLAVGNLQDLQPNWRGSVHGDGRPASAVLAEILDGTGFTFDHGEFASSLEKPCNLSLEGASRIAALEALAAEIGLTPVYESNFMSSDSEENTFSWKNGQRSPAMSFVGPFGVYVRELTENAPNPTGEMEICARAFGLGPEIQSANGRMFEVLTVRSAKGAGAKELLIDADQHWQTEPRQVASQFSIRQGYELGGLLQGVERIDSIEGSIQISAVNKLQRQEFAYGQETIEIGSGIASVNWSNDSFVANFASFPLEGFESNNFDTQFAAWNAEGEAIHITNSSASAWNGKLKLQANFEEQPARLGIAFYSAEEASFPFQLPAHELSKFAQQPSSIASLQFEGQAPVSIEFQSFAANTNPDFPEADFELKNHSNKAVLEMNTSFVYRDASGNELKDFPHTLQGDFDFDGHKPLTKPGETREHRTVAFFRPEDTSTISVKIESIEFTDGTSWKAEE